MLTIICTFQTICIPTQSEYCIYFEHYYVDKDGEKDTSGSTNVYECGDIIIETPKTKYVFHKVYGAYEYCASMIEQIRENREKQDIIIDMNELIHDADFEFFGPFEVLSKK